MVVSPCFSEIMISRFYAYIRNTRGLNTKNKKRLYRSENDKSATALINPNGRHSQSTHGKTRMEILKRLHFSCPKMFRNLFSPTACAVVPVYYAGI